MIPHWVTLTVMALQAAVGWILWRDILCNHRRNVVQSHIHTVEEEARALVTHRKDTREEENLVLNAFVIRYLDLQLKKHQNAFSGISRGVAWEWFHVSSGSNLHQTGFLFYVVLKCNKTSMGEYLMSPKCKHPHKNEFPWNLIKCG